MLPTLYGRKDKLMAACLKSLRLKTEKHCRAKIGYLSKYYDNLDTKESFL